MYVYIPNICTCIRAFVKFQTKFKIFPSRFVVFIISVKLFKASSVFKFFQLFSSCALIFDNFQCSSDSWLLL